MLSAPKVSLASLKSGDVVTHQGSAWVCLAEAVAGRVFDHTQFKLFVKKGSDGKDAR